MVTVIDNDSDGDSIAARGKLNEARGTLERIAAALGQITRDLPGHWIAHAIAVDGAGAFVTVKLRAMQLRELRDLAEEAAQAARDARCGW